ncbi:MAG: serine/threonine-protein kinase [Phycisphaerae bacterium]|nr:serine/threonine-protein kinase [Phycisphaerae bacterium]
MNEPNHGSSRVRTVANGRAATDDPRRHARISELFLEAIDLDPASRNDFLDKACADDPAVRAEVEELIRRDSATAVVDQPLPQNTNIVAMLRSAADAPRAMPKSIGHYEIIDVLGRGGMGTVYRARQTNPSRVVALKVVNPGLWSDSASRRFQFEAEFLAKLHHPNIAQVYEAGSAEMMGMSVPFIAMELVEGVRLTEFVHQRKLGVRDRLRLLLNVCDAVQHAHQRGVIHRDLKPANIIVDAGAQPKILDFGVARLDAANAGDALTAHTATGELVGTLPYMSPEQVAGKPHDVDTRSDQYALGVIAYELLTGHLPLNVNVSMADAIRVIRDDEPARLGTLNRVYRGDVETIIGKALAKDKDRRYPSVADFAADINRYLRNEPIVARPASLAEQLGKFTRRHRALVIGVAATMAALTIGVIGTTYGLLQARAERDDAVAARLSAEKQTNIAKAVNRFMSRMFDSANPLGEDLNPNPNLTVRELLERESAKLDDAFPNQPLLEAHVRVTVGVAFRNLSRLDEAERHLSRALQLFERDPEASGHDVARAMREMAGLALERGDADAGIRLFREALEKERAASGPDHWGTAISEGRLAAALIQAEKLDEVEPLLQHCIRICEATEGEEAAEGHASALHNLAYLRRKLGDNESALQLYEQARTRVIELYGQNYPTVASIDANTAMILMDQGKFDEAERRLRRAIELRAAAFGHDHPLVADLYNNLAWFLADRVRYDEAIPMQRAAVEIHRRLLGDCHPDYVLSLANLAALLGEAGRWDLAEGLTDEVRQTTRSLHGETHWRSHYADTAYARSLIEQGAYAEAEAVLPAAYSALVAARPLPASHTRAATKAMILLYEGTGRAEQAAELQALLDEIKK